MLNCQFMIGIGEREIFRTADSMGEKSARALIMAKYSRFMCALKDGMRLRMAGKRIVGGSRSARMIFKNHHTSNTGGC
jgi:hypothetical protein